MLDIHGNISGEFNVLFVGREEYVRGVKIDSVIRDSRGDLLMLLGPDDTIYNWNNIVIMRKAKL